jgi:hypothetical protein
MLFRFLVLGLVFEFFETPLELGDALPQRTGEGRQPAAEQQQDDQQKQQQFPNTDAGHSIVSQVPGGSKE